MRTRTLIAILFCLVSSGISAQSSADTGAVTKVLALENTWNRAEKLKDIKAMDALFDNSIVYVDYNGAVKNKAEFLAGIKSTAAQPQQEVTESMTGRSFGNVVIVTGIYAANGVENGKPYVRRGRFVDSWVFKNGSWLCVASQATPMH